MSGWQWAESVGADGSGQSQWEESVVVKSMSGIKRGVGRSPGEEWKVGIEEVLQTQIRDTSEWKSGGVDIGEVHSDGDDEPYRKI